LKLELKNSLSVKLLRVVLLSALIVGVVLSCAQIVFDAYKHARPWPAMPSASSTCSATLDPGGLQPGPEMGMQVIEGLFQDDGAHGLHRPSQRNHARGKIP
jgi:hypothetical protein